MRGGFRTSGGAARAVAAACLALFLAGSLLGLARLPRIYQDESLVAAPGYFLFTTGRFAFPPDAGHAGTEAHVFSIMPLHSILVGAALAGLGPSLFAARLVSLALALLVLALTYALGERLFSPAAGAAAVSLLAFAPLQEPIAHLRLGLPLADLARLTRYDLSTGFFGLVAFAVLVPSLARRVPPPRREAALAGALVGLATLCHANGVLFLPALVAAALAAAGRAAWRAVLPLLAGFGACLLPWAIWALLSRADWADQNLPYARRAGFLHVDFYLSNLRHEVDRYGLVLRAARGRPGPWIFGAAFLAGGLALARRWRDARDGAARALLPAFLVFALLLALLAASKNVLYLAPLWPFAALVAGFGAVEAWRRLRGAGRAALVAAALVLAGDAGARVAAAVAEGRATTPYATFLARVADAIPAGRRTMAMPDFWLGLAKTRPDVVTFPFHLTLPNLVRRPVPFGEAADARAPSVVLVNAPVRGLLTEQAPPDAPLHALAVDVAAWLATRTSPLTTLEDATYGPVEVRAVAAPGSPSTAAARP